MCLDRRCFYLGVLTATRLLTAGEGSFSFTGLDAGLFFGYVISADEGSFLLMGVNAGLTATRLLTAGEGAFIFSGEQSGLYKGYLVSAGEGYFIFTGEPATLTTTRLLTADEGLFALTGEAAGLQMRRGASWRTTRRVWEVDSQRSSSEQNSNYRRGLEQWHDSTQTTERMNSVSSLSV